MMYVLSLPLGVPVEPLDPGDMAAVWRNRGNCYLRRSITCMTLSRTVRPETVHDIGGVSEELSAFGIPWTFGGLAWLDKGSAVRATNGHGHAINRGVI